jgi:hypothetical protein
MVLVDVKCYFESTPSLAAEAETPILAEGSPLDVSLADQATLLQHTHATDFSAACSMIAGRHDNARTDLVGGWETRQRSY